MARASKIEILSRVTSYCPGRATSPTTEIFMSANCTLTDGSLIYPPSTILSAMSCASSLRVFPLQSIFPITGMSSMPFSSTVRICSDWLVAELYEATPVTELSEVDELNGTASSGSLLLTTIVSRSRGLIRIWPLSAICSGVNGFASCRYQARFCEAQDETSRARMAGTKRRKCFILLLRAFCFCIRRFISCAKVVIFYEINIPACPAILSHFHPIRPQHGFFSEKNVHLTSRNPVTY